MGKGGRHMSELVEKVKAKALKIYDMCPEPLRWLIGDLIEYNIKYWVLDPETENTVGRSEVLETGFTRNQLKWIKKLLEKNEFKEFFKAMLNRLEEKRAKYGDSWKTTPLMVLRARIVEEYIEWDKASLKDTLEEEMKKLVDLANQCMLLFIRLKQFLKQADKVMLSGGR